MGKPDITECYMVIFVEQLDKTLLDWCKNKWINNLNVKININKIFLSYSCVASSFNSCAAFSFS